MQFVICLYHRVNVGNMEIEKLANERYIDRKKNACLPHNSHLDGNVFAVMRLCHSHNALVVLRNIHLALRRIH